MLVRVMTQYVHWIYLLLVILLLPNVRSKRYHSIAGPFRIDIKRIEKCPAEIQSANKIDFYFRSDRFSPTQHDLITQGNITMPFYLENSHSARLTMASWSSGGGWKENAFNFNLPRICDVLENMMTTLWHPFLMAALGERVACPLYPGSYRFANYTCSWRDMPVKQFFYGRWRADLKIIHKNGNVSACARLFADTLPV